MPAHFPPAAKALVGALLTRQPRQRLGSCGAFGGRCGGAVDVACHPFVARIDWRALLAREVEAPVVPVVAAPGSSRVDLASIETVLAMPQGQELLETSEGGASAGRGQYAEFTAVEEEGAAPST